jgi:hypothetical protein
VKSISKQWLVNWAPWEWQRLHLRGVREDKEWKQLQSNENIRLVKAEQFPYLDCSNGKSSERSWRFLIGQEYDQLQWDEFWFASVGTQDTGVASAKWPPNSFLLAEDLICDKNMKLGPGKFMLRLKLNI